ncbi:hypothetical protein CERSUDRAFT_114338 [Gelatoporia subvermispora B]|uniref:DUF6535 domain-containing protein n=1 Tax=Ceriporiopsis subvermispora (strain B) TaxID=914234 RepID=M2RFU9_CERS8|nr:hypothetical protein CERSUDRAFT_114338 [Gelatoporia subvermispora B]
MMASGNLGSTSSVRTPGGTPVSSAAPADATHDDGTDTRGDANTSQGDSQSPGITPEVRDNMMGFLQEVLTLDHMRAQLPGLYDSISRAVDSGLSFTDPLGQLMMRRVERAAGSTLVPDDVPEYFEQNSDNVSDNEHVLRNNHPQQQTEQNGGDATLDALRAIVNHELGPNALPLDPSEEEKCKCFRHIRPHYQLKPADEATNKAWASCAKRLKEHDEAVAKTWKEEIDTLLVFSGLFSAILTAFNVELYTSLAPAANPDLNSFILLQISGQLSNITSTSPSAPSVLPILSASSIDSPPSVPSIWINVLWFSSLALSLSTACMGIVVRQWLNHFVSISVTEPKESAFIHRLRWDEGIIPWRVPEITSTLPILLQLSLILFLAGLLILLATLNTIVACVFAGIVAVLLLFLVFTTTAPAFRPKCPYKSPQALVFYWIAQRVASLVMFRKLGDVLYTFFKRKLGKNITGMPSRVRAETSLPSHGQPRDAPKGNNWDLLAKVRSYFASLADTATAPGESYWSWRAQEQIIVGKELNVRSEAWLRSWQTNKTEAHLLLAADSLLTDDSFLREVVEPCILQSAYNAKDVIDNIALIIASRPLSYNATMAIALGSMKLIPRILAIESHVLAKEIATQFIRTLSPHIAAFQTTPTNQSAFIVGYARLCSDIFPVELRVEIAEQLVKIQSAAFGWRKPVPTDEPPVPHDNIYFFAIWAVDNIRDAMNEGDWATGFYTTSVVLFLACMSPASCYKKHLQFMVRGVVNLCMRYRATWIPVIREARACDTPSGMGDHPGRCFIEDVLTLIECHEHGAELVDWKDKTANDPWFADPLLKELDWAMVDSNERDFH